MRTSTPEPHQHFFESVGFRILVSRRLTLWSYLGKPALYLITYGVNIKPSVVSPTYLYIWRPRFAPISRREEGCSIVRPTNNAKGAKDGPPFAEGMPLVARCDIAPGPARPRALKPGKILFAYVKICWTHYTSWEGSHFMNKPLVAVIMGSTSDWETMKNASDVLARFGVEHENQVVSAHRTPQWLATFASKAEARGIQVIIAGAGGAAHLPGMAAAYTTLPVLGVPVESKALKGLDSLLSIVQMPAGIPVGTLAIGAAGASNAGYLAVNILATTRPELKKKLKKFREDQTAKVRRAKLSPRSPNNGATLPRLVSPERGGNTACEVRRRGKPRTYVRGGGASDIRPEHDCASRSDDRRARKRPARPHVRDRRTPDGISRPHVFARHQTRPRTGRRQGMDRILHGCGGADRIRARDRRRDVRVRKYPVDLP